MRLLLLIFLLSSIHFTVNAQGACTGPGRDVNSAEAVCGNITFRENDVSSCDGFANLPNPTAGCGDIVTTDNSRWYKFHCYQAGTMGFLLTPLSAGDDYDWEILDITGRNPNDVYTMELRVSLNLSGQTGPTGCTATGASDVNCGGGTPGSQFNRLMNLQAGHDYLMMVNNWSSSGTGYDINFLGNAVLTNNLPPTITGVSIVGCDASKLKVTFSEDIICDSISPVAGTEFTITNGVHPITGIVSNCTQGANGIPSLILNLQTPLAPGNYQLNVANGSDGNTLANICLLLMLPASVPFNVPMLTPVEVDTITFTGCAPNLIRVKLTKPVWCNSITPSGVGGELSFLPANPPITIAAIQSSCNNGQLYTDELQVYLQDRLPHGNYQLVINNGGDGNTFIDTCNNQMLPVTVPFVINQTTVAPVIQSIVFDECQPAKLVVNFDKPVLCSTLSPSKFTITPGPVAVTGVGSTCVNANSYVTQVTLTLQSALPAGNFTLTIGNGTGTNTIADTCYAFMPAGHNKTFVTTKAPAPKYDSVQFDKCDPSLIRVFYSKPINCGSVHVVGIEFNITGPSPVNIASVSGENGNCFNSTTLLLHLAQPITTFGTYTLHNRPGPDGNSVVDTCGAEQDNAETISFLVLGKPSAAFTSQVKFACKMDTVILTHPGGSGINSWQWTFDDGSTATGQTVTKLFPVSTPTVGIQLIVTNGFCSDTVSNSITLGNAFSAAFVISTKDTTCINTPITFTNNSAGNNLQYLWLFDDNTQFAGQTPPPHVYTTAGIYNIKLVVTDPYGCADTAVTILHVTAMPSIDFTGLNAQYCTDKTIALTRVISNNINNYTWDNGDGITFQNKPVVQFSYPKEGVYTITLTGTDKYCGAATVSKSVNIFAVPKFNLGNDTVLCPAVALPIGVAFTNGYTYLWNTGAITPQIFTDIVTADYSLLVDNNGCKATDAIAIKVLPACLIKVANAFTPNSDGKNDLLKAVNADLAKEFTLKVYNRFGEQMFSTTNPLDGWNGYHKGIRADAGTYVWQLSYINPWNNQKVFESGTSILIR
jgi:gliding motility-associated-like protein